MSQSHQREPIFNLPPLLFIVVGALICVHLWPEYGKSDQDKINFFFFFSFIPDFFYENDLGYADSFGLNLFRMVSYSLLHADWAHLNLNLIWLVIFGTPLIRQLGTIRFLLFWILTAALSALAHFAFHTTSSIPLVGASGVVSAMMGAAARYGFYYVDGGILLPMHRALMNKSIAVFIGVWLAVNIFIGFGTVVIGENPIAWQAHIGGLIAGFVLIDLFVKKKK